LIRDELVTPTPEPIAGLLDLPDVDWEPLVAS
jgi:hypothetical protein